MAIEVTKQARIPVGRHNGIIIAAEEKKTVFDAARGPEPTLEIVIQPAWRDPNGGETLPVRVSFSPVLNGLSALSKLLARIEREPKGGAWEPTDIIGTEVTFTAKLTDRDFINVDKDSIRAPDVQKK